MPNNAKRKKPRRHFNKKLYVPLGVLAAALAVYLGFKCTEDGTFTVLNYSEEEPVVATYKHFAFAKRKLESLDASSTPKMSAKTRHTPRPMARKAI